MTDLYFIKIIYDTIFPKEKKINVNFNSIVKIIIKPLNLIEEIHLQLLILDINSSNFRKRIKKIIRLTTKINLHDINNLTDYELLSLLQTIKKYCLEPIDTFFNEPYIKNFLNINDKGYNSNNKKSSEIIFENIILFISAIINEFNIPNYFWKKKIINFRFCSLLLRYHEIVNTNQNIQSATIFQSCMLSQYKSKNTSPYNDLINHYYNILGKNVSQRKTINIVDALVSSSNNILKNRQQLNTIMPVSLNDYFQFVRDDNEVNHEK